MEPEIPASSTQIGQDARGVIGQTVVGATVIYGLVTIIQGSQASASEHTASPAATDVTTTSAPTPAEESHNPYQGLLAFQPSDGDRFFGRNAEIEDLWQRFRALHEQADATRLLVVYGPSGSGKSSLVRAGLVPELARRPLGGKAKARIALLVPGSQPLQALANVLACIVTNDPAPVRKTREFAEELALANGDGEHDGLQRIGALLPEADVWPLLVVVDQLEELYSLCPDAAMRQAFLANLLRAAADRSGQVAVLVTLRSDFLGATQADPALNRLIQAQGVFIAALSEQGLRDAIRLPVERRNRSLDAATVDLLVEQSLGRDGALPLLQFALLRIWEGLLRGQPAAETLRQIGGVGGALAGEAQRIFDSLTDEGDQRIARRLFLNLVQLGEGSRDTRRRVALQEVIAKGEDPAATRRVIERFASPAVRLITRSSGQDGRESLELSHEALIEAWPSLREWLTSSRADLRFQRRLEDAAALWEHSGKPEGRLWRLPDLDELDEFRAVHEADLTSRQLAFAEASKNTEQKRLQRELRSRRRVLWGLAGSVTLVSIVLALIPIGRPPTLILGDEEFRFSAGSHQISKTFLSKLEAKVIPQIIYVLSCFDVDTIEIVGHTDGQPLNTFGRLDAAFLRGKEALRKQSEIQAGSNADLGLLRALAVQREVKSSVTKYLPYARYRAYSAGSTINIDGAIDFAPGEQDGRRRRMEIRFTRSGEDVLSIHEIMKRCVLR